MGPAQYDAAAMALPKIQLNPEILNMRKHVYAMKDDF